jgi:hypothetical protein
VFFLHNWLISHILQSDDAEFGRFIALDYNVVSDRGSMVRKQRFDVAVENGMEHVTMKSSQQNNERVIGSGERLTIETITDYVQLIRAGLARPIP